MVDENDNPIVCNPQQYNKVSLEVGQWIDARLQEHLQTFIGKQVKEDEGKSENSPETSDSGEADMLNVS